MGRAISCVMAAGTMIKDFGGVYARLFDHRPVIKQEIQFMIKEFEEKRKWREENNLREMLDICHQVSNDEVPRAISSLDSSLPDVLAKLKTSNEMCQGILQRENKYNQTDLLKENRSKRVKEWVDFMDKMCVKSKAIDDESDTEIKSVESYYQELEDKLKLNT